MANTIKLKRSATQGAVPSTAQLQLGELAINTYDGKVYLKKDNGTASIVEVGGVTSFNTRTGAVTLSSSDVTTALGYTPYNSTNPNGYTSNTGTVTSVSLSVPTGLSVSGSPVTGSGTLSVTTTLSGVLKGTGSGFAAATAGTDYLAPPSGTSILKANSGGALTNAVAGTDYQAPLVSGTNIKTINGTSLLGSGDVVVGGSDLPLLALGLV